MAIEHWQEILRVAIGRQPVVLVGGARHRHLVIAARRLGAAWVGDIGPGDVEVAADATSTFDDDWRGWLDHLDPARAALVMGQNFHPYPTYASRRFVGTRRAEWRVFEDKPAMWELLAADGVALAPWSVVPAAAEPLLAAVRVLDEGSGTVWAGDHREGEHSGGRHVRVVVTSAQAESASAYFASCCDRVRVMPLLHGTPCSIHCFVSDDEIAPLWPVRVDAKLDIDAGMFAYLGADWMWSAPGQLVESAQRFATQAGALMCNHAGYRGVFCVDGVAVGDVFHPTEVNSRWGASLTTLASQQPDFALRFIHAFLADGFEADWRLTELVGALRAARSGRRLSPIAGSTSSKAPRRR